MTGKTGPENVTGLLARWRTGSSEADQRLMEAVQAELRRLARSYLRRERPDHTLQPTALVNEAYIKLFGDLEPQLADRAHFVALMSRVMRQVLVDHARSSGAAKRGGADGRVPLDTNIEIGDDRGSEQLNLLDLHRALEALERENAPLAHVVEMHYFGGMTAEEVAASTHRSVHVIRHDLRLARAWLRRELARLPPE